MDQATFDFVTRPAAATADRCGFEIGWDHACHGLAPPPVLLAAPSAIAQGWQAARAVFGHRSRSSTPALRQWLALRLESWEQGLHYDLATLSAADLARMAVRRCPVLRQPLGGGSQDALGAAHLCLDPLRGHGGGRTVMLSRAAAQAADGLGLAEVLQRARAAATAAGSTHPGDAHNVPAPLGVGDDASHAASPGAPLDAPAWRRLAVLRSFATPLPFAVAVGLPLVLLPPPGVQPCNAVQRLQVLLTLQFASPGWAARLRRLAATLTDPAQRHDLHLLVGALAPRVLEAETAARSEQRPQPAWREMLEDAWLHERVLRRWQAWVLGLGEAGAHRMLQRLQQIGAQAGACSTPCTLPPGSTSHPSQSPPAARAGLSAASARRGPRDRLPPAQSPRHGVPLRPQPSWTGLGLLTN
jgi:hypothetical protein